MLEAISATPLLAILTHAGFLSQPTNRRPWPTRIPGVQPMTEPRHRAAAHVAGAKDRDRSTGYTERAGLL